MKQSVFLFVGVIAGGLALIVGVALIYGHFMNPSGASPVPDLDKLPAALEPHGDAIRAAAVPCIRLKPVRTKEPLDLAASRFSGQPCMNRNESWPQTSSGDPMTFVGQVNFSEIAEVVRKQGGQVPPDLPRQGVLGLFCDMDGFLETGYRGNARLWSIVWVSDPQTGVAGSSYNKLSRHAPVFRLVPSAAKSLPCAMDSTNCPAVIKERALTDEYSALVKGLAGRSVNQLLGYALAVKSDPRQEAQGFGGVDNRGISWGRRSPDEGNAWRLLWQIDSDPTTGFMWGDGGSLFIMIREADLRASRLGESNLIYQEP
jgi:uncharacterized protein YwqG